MTRPVRRLRFVAPVAAVAVALLVILGYGVVSSGGNSSIDQALAAGQRPVAPALSLPALGASGQRSLAGYRGKVVVLNFWASWCTPCEQEAPVLERWQRAMSSQSGTVLGVDVLDVRSDALAFARRFDVTYPLVRDGDGSHEHAFGVVGYPETLVIDRRGRIAAVQRGPVDDAFLATKVVPLLRERS